MQNKTFAEIARPALVLFLVCLLSATALTVANSLTRENITKNAAQRASDSRSAIFPGASLTAQAIDGTTYYKAEKNGVLIGYAIDASAKGYGGDVGIIVGIGADGKVLTVQVVAADGETPGLGQNVKDASFLEQFKNLQSAMSETQLDAVASATYSSRAVMEGVNDALSLYARFAGGAQ
ncbi:MAG: FMN-binding protein [Oscillospiraceae bacterium]|jgi:electron transport complex protein RnfG|nr:FMN-binding protein [Oscillospiraceae bacterium]